MYLIMLLNVNDLHARFILVFILNGVVYFTSNVEPVFTSKVPLLVVQRQ
jgi:hypothetical protein